MLLVLGLTGSALRASMCDMPTGAGTSSALSQQSYLDLCARRQPRGDFSSAYHHELAAGWMLRACIDEHLRYIWTIL